MVFAEGCLENVQHEPFSTTTRVIIIICIYIIYLYILYYIYTYYLPLYFPFCLTAEGFPSASFLFHRLIIGYRVVF